MENKKKYAYWMQPSLVADIENAFADTNFASKSEFVCEAVKFYVGYLRQEKNIDYLSPIIGSVIKSEIDTAVRNICEMLYKMAVEQSLHSYLLAYHDRIDVDELPEIQDWCADIVAKTNGVLDFKQAHKIRQKELYG